MDFKAMSLSNKLILGATGIAIISLFLPWVDLGILSASGFQQQGYLFLIAFLYPLFCVIKNKPIHKIGGLACGIIAVVIALLYINAKSESFFGTTINAAGSGIYLFLIASIVLLVAGFLNKKAA